MQRLIVEEFHIVLQKIRGNYEFPTAIINNSLFTTKPHKKFQKYPID